VSSGCRWIGSPVYVENAAMTASFSRACIAVAAVAAATLRR
jgi:hypothetical protein